MYTSFYGLTERPFELTPNPRFLLMTQGHREALSTIEYGIAGRKGLTLVIGPAGTGKTTLIHAALERQSGGNAKAIYLTNPTLSREELFQFLALELELPAEAAESKTQFLRDLREVLLARHKSGAITALVVDEAQSMPDELLQEIRLLENLESDSQKLLPVVLVGQIELAERLKQPSLQALKQRISLRSSLAPLTVQETAAYVAERIRIAGGDIRMVFTPAAVAAVCESSGGIPRNISVLCDNAMVGGFATDQRPIGVDLIVEVCRDFDLPLPSIATTTDGFVATAAALATRIETRPAAPPAAAPAAAPVVQPPAPVMTRIQMSVTPPAVERLMADSVDERPRRVPFRIRVWRALAAVGRVFGRIPGIRSLMVKTRTASR